VDTVYMSEDLKVCCRTFLLDLRSTRLCRGTITCIPKFGHREYLNLSQRHLTHPSPNFTVCHKMCDFSHNCLWAVIISKRSKISEIFLNFVCFDDRTMTFPKLVKFGPCPFHIIHIGIWAHPKQGTKSVFNYQ